MVTTDSNGIVFYEENDLFAPVHTALNLLSASVSDALDEVIPATADTGWVNLTDYLGGNYAPSTAFRARRVGDDVEISGQVNRTTLSFAPNTLYAIATNIPAQFRPKYTVPGTIQFSGAIPGVGYLDNSGTISVEHYHTGTRAWLYLSFRFYVGE